MDLLPGPIGLLAGLGAGVCWTNWLLAANSLTAVVVGLAFSAAAIVLAIVLMVGLRRRSRKN